MSLPIIEPTDAATSESRVKVNVRQRTATAADTPPAPDTPHTDTVVHRLETLVLEQSRNMDKLINMLCQQIKQGSEIIEATKEATKARSDTVTNNFNNYTMNNTMHMTVVLDPNFYGSLVSSMGVDATHKYLERLSIEHSPLQMVHDLFITNKPATELPIARRGNHYRYMNNKRELVDDMDGELLCELISNCTTNAYLLATSALSHGDLAPQDRLDQFRRIQTYACSMRTDLNKAHIKQCLTSWIPDTGNTHPFFCK